MWFFFKPKVKGHCYSIKDRRHVSPSSPSGRNGPFHLDPAIADVFVARNNLQPPHGNKARPDEPLQRLRKLREDSGVLRSMEDAPLVTRRHRLLQHSPFSRAANNIDLPSSYLFSVNIAPRLSGLITLKDEGNVSSVTVKPSIGEVIDKGRLSF